MRRTCLVGAFVALIALAFGVAGSAAAGKGNGKKPAKPKPTIVKVTCRVSQTVQVPAGQSEVIAPLDSGTEYGAVSCSKGLGKGVQFFSFALADSGDTVGPYKQYFDGGTLKGKLDLSPSSTAPVTVYNFNAETFTGTGTVTGGTGAYKGAKGKSTLTCQSDDSIHISCLEKLKLTLPAA